MNFKTTHFFSTLLAAVALSTFAGAASADACNDIQTFGLANRPAIEASLAKHYVSRANVVLLGVNNVRIQDFKGCRARVKMRAGLVKIVGNNPEFGAVKDTLNGSMEMFVYFNAAQGNQMCVAKTDLQKVQFKDMGPVKEKLFVRRNDDKNFFGGCLAS